MDPGKTSTIYDIPGHVKEAFMSAMTPRNIRIQSNRHIPTQIPIQTKKKTVVYSSSEESDISILPSNTTDYDSSEDDPSDDDGKNLSAGDFVICH